MNLTEFTMWLKSAFVGYDLGDLLPSDAETKLFHLFRRLVEANRVTNLTAITDEKGVILKHFVDSATISRHISLGSAVIDVGCGAGFPSLPLAILRSDLKITALDSTAKKIDCVKCFASELELDNVSAVCSRAEEYVRDKREAFDVCTSRAVARMNVLSELCLPFIKVGGSFIAMKSNKALEEYDEALSGIKKLGGTYANSFHLSLTLEEETIEREIYCFSKVASTPQQFPRKYAQIIKKPL